MRLAYSSLTIMVGKSVIKTAWDLRGCFLYLFSPFRQGDFSAIEPDVFLIVQLDQELAGIRDIFGKSLIGLVILLKSDRSS